MATRPHLKVGDRIRFDDDPTAWLVRGHSTSGRYTLATYSVDSKIEETVVDWETMQRGPVDLPGWPILTDSGPDDAVDEILVFADATEGPYDHPGEPTCVTAHRSAGKRFWGPVPS